MVDQQEFDEEDDDDNYEGLTPAFYFVNDVAVKIAEKHDKNGKQSLRKEQLALMRVWQVSGIVENGALAYFFEHRFDVNEVIRAYETVGMPEPAAILKKAVAVFPNSTPPADFEKLIDFMYEHDDTFNSLSTKFLRAGKSMVAILGDYIRNHEAAFKEFMK
jgi:uncharacterized protein DUF4375